MIPCDCLDIYEDAVFYDLEFATRDTEIPFFLRHARAASGPVLEVACGTGRLTLPIAREGIDIAGIDISAPMLEQARLKSRAENLNVNWLEQDCRNMHPGRLFALIFSATNAMQHLLDVDSACAFLRSASRTLLPGGRLIIDVFNPDPAKLLRPATERYLHKTITTPSGGTIRVETASHYRSDTQVLHFDLFYLNGSGLLRTKSVNMRCFFPEELLALCRFNGLEVVHRFGNYDESSFAAGSPKQIIICQSTGASSP
jgi:ubiquinone/menaquinone biosynthesis C-methylase UbiE